MISTKNNKYKVKLSKDFNFEHWAFAIINNRLTEFFFHNNKRGKSQISGHCYVAPNEYKTKAEQKMIIEDTKKYRFSYYNKKYTEKPEL